MSRLSKKLHIFSRLTALLCTLMLCAVLWAPAAMADVAPYSGTTGDLSWSLANGILTISGKGAIPDYTEDSPAPWHPHRESIVRIRLSGNITTIGNMAFYEHTALAAVSLPRSVTAVGDMAFAGCEALETVKLPQVTTLGTYAFSRCFALADIDLPTTLTTLGDYVFYRCESLPYTHIPASVTAMGSSAFAYCYGLLRVDVEARLTALPEWCFYGCERLTAITLPASVTDMGDSAFTRCDALQIVYYGGHSDTWDVLSESIAESLPDFTVSQMAPANKAPVSVSGQNAVTENDVLQETTTEIQQKEDVFIRVEQTIVYPMTDGIAGKPEELDATIHATIRGEQGWDTLMDEISDQYNDRTSFERDYGEQPPLQVEITLQEDASLPGTWLGALAGRDVIVTVSTPDGSRFTVNGQHIVDYEFKETYPLTYTLTAYTDVSDSDRVVVGSASCWWLSFDAAFNFPVTVDVLLDPYAAHQNATLYEKLRNDSLQQLQSARLDESGYVSFRLSTINKTTRYLLALNVAGTSVDKVVVPEGDKVIQLAPLDEMYEFAEPRGFMGMTMGEFTRFMLMVGGSFVVVVLVMVLFFVIRGKRKAKIASIRAKVMGTDPLAELQRQEQERKEKKERFSPLKKAKNSDRKDEK